MSHHTLAVFALACFVAQVSALIGQPKDTRPWTAQRTTSTVFGVAWLVFALWLIGAAL